MGRGERARGERALANKMDFFGLTRICAYKMHIFGCCALIGLVRHTKTESNEFCVFPNIHLGFYERLVYVKTRIFVCEDAMLT